MSRWQLQPRSAQSPIGLSKARSRTMGASCQTCAMSSTGSPPKPTAPSGGRSITELPPAGRLAPRRRWPMGSSFGTLCPMCGGHAPVIESRVCGNGSRRQRRACQGCGHRWTTHQGTPPQRCRNRLTAQEVERIIKTVDQLTAELNCSRGTVVSVLQRPETISCLRCVHWSGACGMGFPDPVEEGPGAAQWCSCFAVD